VASEANLNEPAGSCWDLGVLFCDLCRIVGIACRFVSGDECASGGQPDWEMHAWAKAHFPSARWKGYDPSRGLETRLHMVAEP
jgi:transglutaminase-like putative cysteine protease